MARIFTPRTFGFVKQDVRVEGAVISGGRSLSGIDDPISADGGGYIVAEYGDGTIIDRNKVKAWRAQAAAMENGAAPFIVHLCDSRHQPAQHPSVPHSDGTPFSDDAEYVGTTTAAETAADADLRATTLTISYDGLETLVGGEWFSIDHPLWSWRAYSIISVTPNGLNFDIEFRPPLREAVAAGTTVEFDDPRCCMRGRPGGNLLEHSRVGSAQVAWVEDMRRPGA